MTAVLLLLLWGYLVFIGLPVSAARAGLFWTVLLLALRLRMLVSLPTVLLLAVLVFVSIAPRLVVDVGFQLSVSAVVGIFMVLFLARNFRERMPAYLTSLATLMLVSLGAVTTTWPLVSYHFGLVSLVSLVANLVVVPVIPLLLVTSIGALIAHNVVPIVALWLAFGVRLGVSWITWVTAILASWQYAFVTEKTTPLWAVLAYYVGLGALSAALMRYQKRSWRELWQ
jgi:competence protein ComEC